MVRIGIMTDLALIFNTIIVKAGLRSAFGWYGLYPGPIMGLCDVKPYPNEDIYIYYIPTVESTIRAYLSALPDRSDTARIEGDLTLGKLYGYLCPMNLKEANSRNLRHVNFNVVTDNETVELHSELISEDITVTQLTNKCRAFARVLSCSDVAKRAGYRYMTYSIWARPVVGYQTHLLTKHIV